MSPLSLDFHPRALTEARAARRWYARRSARVASQFLAELDHALAQILAAPQQWPAYLHNTRVYQRRRFPYLSIYRELPAVVRIIAVAPSRRRPGYWSRRLP